MLGHILSFQRWKQWCCIWLSLEKRKEKDVKELWWVYSILRFVCQGVNSNVPGTAVQSCWAQKPGTDCRGGAWYGIFFYLWLHRFKDLRIQRAAGSLWNPPSSLHKQDYLVAIGRKAGQLLHGTCRLTESRLEKTFTVIESDCNPALPGHHCVPRNYI